MMIHKRWWFSTIKKGHHPYDWQLVKSSENFTRPLWALIKRSIHVSRPSTLNSVKLIFLLGIKDLGLNQQLQIPCQIWVSSLIYKGQQTQICWRPHPVLWPDKTSVREPAEIYTDIAFIIHARTFSIIRHNRSPSTPGLSIIFSAKYCYNWFVVFSLLLIRMFKCGCSNLDILHWTYFIVFVHWTHIS